MKTRTPILNHLIRHFRNTGKSTKEAGTKQRTSFTPAMEDLETRALLTTMPGLTFEPTADAAAQVADSQKNDAAYIKFDGIMSGTDTGALEEIADSQKNDAAYIKFDGIMQAPSRTIAAHQAAVDQLFTQQGLNVVFNPATFR